MRLKYPGLIQSTMPSGNTRWLVRVKGQPSKRITLATGPDSSQFHEIYHAARQGIKLTPHKTDAQTANTGTVAWLVYSYIEHLERMVEAGQASPLTLKQRRSFARQLVSFNSTTGASHGKPYAGLPMEIPQSELILFRDSFAATPGKAKNMFKFLRAMYVWALERAHCSINPAAGIKVTYKSGGGATPWSMDDLIQYRKIHPPGTSAHLCLTLFMFTACRISDAIILGHDNEFVKNGTRWIGWQPVKAGSSFVELPMMEPLKTAIARQPVAHPNAYLLTQHGRPFKSSEGLRNRLKKWCIQADLPNLSSHGIRKAGGELLSLHGASQYEIMAIHGHANASTSEIYTRGADRQRLAASATSKLTGLDW